MFPEWLRKTGYAGEATREIIEYAYPQPRVRFERGGPFSRRVRIVCKDCNNGWMSRLENEAKPLLLQMFSATGQIPLDQSMQLLLARWGFKTTAVLAQVTESPAPFPLEHCRELRRENQPPKQSQIWIGTASIRSEPLGPQLAGFYYEPHEATVESGQGPIRFPGYHARFCLFNVVFEVFGFTSNVVSLRLEWTEEGQRALVPIWPPESRAISWPPPEGVDTLGGLVGDIRAMPAQRMQLALRSVQPTIPKGERGSPRGDG
jgi:hypothetical protein